MTTEPRLTEDQIERQVERLFARLDRQFMNSPMTDVEYNAKCREIDRWAEIAYRNAKITDPMGDPMGDMMGRNE
jgi:hypothetical protein